MILRTMTISIDH